MIMMDGKGPVPDFGGDRCGSGRFIAVFKQGSASWSVSTSIVAYAVTAPVSPRQICWVRNLCHGCRWAVRSGCDAVTRGELPARRAGVR
jgi:hypothetical protein